MSGFIEEAIYGAGIITWIGAMRRRWVVELFNRYFRTIRITITPVTEYSEWPSFYGSGGMRIPTSCHVFIQTNMDIVLTSVENLSNGGEILLSLDISEGQKRYDLGLRPGNAYIFVFKKDKRSRRERVSIDGEVFY